MHHISLLVLEAALLTKENYKYSYTMLKLKKYVCSLVKKVHVLLHRNVWHLGRPFSLLSTFIFVPDQLLGLGKSHPLSGFAMVE